jgi:hypothetical protein
LAAGRARLADHLVQQQLCQQEVAHVVGAELDLKTVLGVAVVCSSSGQQ